MLAFCLRRRWEDVWVPGSPSRCPNECSSHCGDTAGQAGLSLGWPRCRPARRPGSGPETRLAAGLFSKHEPALGLEMTQPIPRDLGQERQTVDGPCSQLQEAGAGCVVTCIQDPGQPPAPAPPCWSAAFSPAEVFLPGEGQGTGTCGPRVDSPQVRGDGKGHRSPTPGTTA